MRRAAILVVPLLLLLVPAGAGAATKRERQRIGAERGVTAAATKAARVFTLSRGDEHALYGCLRAIVRGGAERVVDAGPGVEPGSLAVAGQRLYWTRDGVAQAAQAG